MKIVIADDHPLIREGLSGTLRKAGHEVVGEAGNGKDLLTLLDTITTDIIIMDIIMPVMNGIAATEKILKRFPDINIIALSMLDDEYALVDILEAGARGYLVKSAAGPQVLEAVEKVASGFPYYASSKVSPTLEKKIYSSSFDPYRNRTRQMVEFTDQELKIIRLVCKGKTSKEIAAEIFLSVRTVEWHRVNILKKLNVDIPLGIVIYALRHGLVSLEELP